jgi:hypothetical protein
MARIVFYVVFAMPFTRQRVARHIPAEANYRNNRTPIARQRYGKQALSTIQAVFREVRVKCEAGSCGELRRENETESFRQLFIVSCSD